MRDIGRSVLHRPVPIAATLGLLVALVAAAPVLAGRPEVTRSINNHFHLEQHFPANYACGPYGWGVTEIAEGNEHFVVVDDGARLTLTYGETFRITAVPDDPSIPTNTRQGSDALTFVLQRDGDVMFHESFHDFGPAAWDSDAQIRFVTVFTTRDGEVQVDHSIENDMPPSGC